MERRPTLYLAAPYAFPDPVWNTHRVVKFAEVVYAKTAFVPVIPHLSMLWHAIEPHDVSFWYEYDLHVMLSCDYMVRLPGESMGADNELRVALNEPGMAVYSFEEFDLEVKLAWMG